MANCIGVSTNLILKKKKSLFNLFQSKIYSEEKHFPYTKKKGPKKEEVYILICFTKRQKKK